MLLPISNLQLLSAISIHRLLAISDQIGAGASGALSPEGRYLIVMSETAQAKQQSGEAMACH
jgi:hypothetical protein